MYAQSCALAEEGAFDEAMFSAHEYSLEEKPQFNKNSTFEGLDVSPFPFEQTQYSDRSAEPVSRIVPSTCTSSTPYTDFKVSLGSTREIEEMLFGLDLRELKTLFGPEPNEVIPFVRQDDVLCGRGGETNHHAGNIQYRQFVRTKVAT
jgi:hypothetical protein